MCRVLSVHANEGVCGWLGLVRVMPPRKEQKGEAEYTNKKRKKGGNEWEERDRAKGLPLRFGDDDHLILFLPPVYLAILCRTCLVLHPRSLYYRRSAWRREFRGGRESGEKSEREGELRRDGKKEEWVRIQRGFRDCDGNELHCPARAGRTESSFGTRKEEGRLEHRISSSAKKNERRK